VSGVHVGRWCEFSQLCGHVTSTQALAEVLASSSDGSDEELSRATEARLLFDSVTQSLSRGLQYVSLLFSLYLTLGYYYYYWRNRAGSERYLAYTRRRCQLG